MKSAELPAGLANDSLHRPQAVPHHLQWMRLPPILDALHVGIDEGREVESATGSDDPPHEREHRARIYGIEVGEDGEQPDDAELAPDGKRRLVRETSRRLVVVHAVMDVPVDEAKARVDGLDFRVHEIDDRAEDLDARVGPDLDATIDDGLRESHAAADVENILVREAAQPEP